MGFLLTQTSNDVCKLIELQGNQLYRDASSCNKLKSAKRKVARQHKKSKNFGY